MGETYEDRVSHAFEAFREASAQGDRKARLEAVADIMDAVGERSASTGDIEGAAQAASRAQRLRAEANEGSVSGEVSE